MSKDFFEFRESTIRTADKKPEKYIGADGKPHIRMVPVKKDIIKTQNEEKDEWKTDSGWKKPETVRKDRFGNVIKNVPRHLAKAAAKKSAEMAKEEVALDEKKGDLHLYNNEVDARKKAKEVSGKVIKGTGKSTGKWAVKEEVELDEVVQRPLHKGATVKGKFNGKVISGKIVDTPIVQNKAGVTVHWKSGQKGNFPNDHFDTKGYHKSMSEEVELDEVLDRPGALDSYRKKADDSGNRARNSAVRKILTAPKDGKRPDHSDELNTMSKRNKGQDMADRVAARQFRKSIGLGYNAKKEKVEKVAETSQDKLRQYHGKAGADLQAKRDKVAKGELSMADLKKGQNRVKGLNRSANKMEEKKLTPKEIKRALASIKPSKKKPTLPKAPWEKTNESYIPEGLTIGDGMGSWIKDFQASDAPQFAGKSKKHRRDMAIAAYLSKKRGN